MPIAQTRAMVHAVLAGALDDVPVAADPLFGVYTPEGCPGVPGEVLQPRAMWADKRAYDEKAGELAGRFQDNFAQFNGVVRSEIAAAGPAGK
jgi:phosphoenolpyruvate carboxykinase (ATP)